MNLTDVQLFYLFYYYFFRISDIFFATKYAFS